MGWLKSADSPPGDDEAEVRAWLRAVIAWIGDTAVLRPPQTAPKVETGLETEFETDVEAEVTAPAAAEDRPVAPVRLAIVAA